MNTKLTILALIIFTSFGNLFSQINLIDNPENGYKKQNLGENINSEHQDAIPVISADGKTLYFSRIGHPENVEEPNREDIWYSTWNGTKWAKAKNMGRPLNNKAHNGLIALSTDGNMAFVLHEYNSAGEFEKSGLSYTYKNADGTWQMPSPIKIENHYNRANGYNNFTFSPGRKQIIMSVHRDDTKGEQDLYICFLQKDGTYGEPSNLGDVINTSAKEVSPFLASDGVTLYFTSMGHAGYGKGDIFVTRRLDDTWKNWSEPKNLGKEINSEEFDGFFTIPASGDYAYLTSDKNSLGQNDIFRIKLAKSAKPKVTVLIKGNVKLNNKAVPAEIVYYEQNSNKVLGYALANPTDGSYQVSLLAGKSYQIEAIYPGLEVTPKMAHLRGVSKYKEMIINFAGKQGKDFKPILFPYNSAEVKGESASRLSGIINYLQKNTNVKIEISGHTDSQGTNTKNQTLSQERAEAVKNILLESGINESRINVKALASSQAIASNASENGRRLNRRVEIKIVE